jgi:hypothetical protein
MAVDELCIANARTTLEAATIAGASDGSGLKVIRLRPPDDPVFFEILDKSQTVMLFLEQGQTTYVQEAQTFQATTPALWVGTMELFVQVCRVYAGDGPPASRTIDPGERANVAVADVKNALLTTHTRGANARNTILVNSGPIAAPEEVFALHGWTADEVRFLIEYEFSEAAP